MKATSAPGRGEDGERKRRNYRYAVELFRLHLWMNPGDLEARKECRTAQRSLKKHRNRRGFMGKAYAKKVELQAGAIRINKRDPTKTLVLCEELLTEDPDCVVALLRLGESAIAADLLPVAVFALEDALRLDPGNEEAQLLLGQAEGQ